MAIKRYTADADTTITNAFGYDLKTRATGSNIGASDILEVYSIYGQTVSGSSQSKTTELSRILVNFPIADIVVDRASGDIPASGSVNFYLRLFNAKHGSSLPSNFTLSASAVTADWEEGFGLDMEGYTDKTKDGEGVNWTNANGDLTAATLVDAIDTTGVAVSDEFTMTVPAAAGGDATAHSFKFVDTAVAGAGAGNFGIALDTANTPAKAAAAVIDAINGTVHAAVGYGGGANGSVLAAGTIGLTAAEGTNNTDITLTLDDVGAGGNVANVLAANTGFENALLLEATFTGGDGPWSRPGGDYDFDRKSTFNQTFTKGTEDLEIDITRLAEQWLYAAGGALPDKSSARYGVGLFLTGTQEGKHTGDETNGRLHNPSGSVRSYYTKRFFARGSEFFFKRPLLEARWDNSKKDNRASFYLSSSLAPAESVNTLYFYNYIRGQLKDIQGDDSVVPTIEMYIGSGALPETLINMRKQSDNSNQTSISATRASTGIYSVSFAVDDNKPTTTKPYLFDVWKVSGATQHTGSKITPKNFDSYDMNPNDNYATSMLNLKAIYSNLETARLRIFTRKKDWNPTIYSKATTTAEVENVEDAYYKVIRIKDDLTIAEFGTGSLNHTRLSYDVSGSYFDFDMSMLEADNMYAFKYAYYLNGKYVEQPEIFRFRVEKDLTDVE